MRSTSPIYAAAGSPAIACPLTGVCRTCGAQGAGESFAKWVKPTFTDHDKLQPGDVVCPSCLFCFDEQNPDLAAVGPGAEKYGATQAVDEDGDPLSRQKTWDDIRTDSFLQVEVFETDYRATWPNGDEPDGETTVWLKVYGSDETGYIIVSDDNNCGGTEREAGESVYPTLSAAKQAAKAFAKAHDEAE